MSGPAAACGRRVARGVKAALQIRGFRTSWCQTTKIVNEKRIEVGKAAPFQENRLLFSASFCPERTTSRWRVLEPGRPSAVRPPGLAVRRTPDPRRGHSTPTQRPSRAGRSRRSAAPRGRGRLSRSLTSVGHFLYTVRSLSICGFPLLKNRGRLS